MKRKKEGLTATVKILPSDHKRLTSLAIEYSQHQGVRVSNGRAVGLLLDEHEKNKEKKE